MTTYRHAARKSQGYRRTTAQEMRNSLATYKREVSDAGDVAGHEQGARLLKLAEQLCVLLDKEGYADTSSAVHLATRPLYEEVRAKRQAANQRLGAEITEASELAGRRP